MGSYVVYYCKEMEEYIEPGDVNDGAMKTQDVAYRGDLGRLLIHLLSYGYTPRAWPSVAMACDQYDNQPVSHETIIFTYRDVTERAIESYNEVWEPEDDERLIYTPRLNRSV